MVTKSDGAETVQVKEVKSDFESPGTALIVANSDQKSLFHNQAMEKLKKKMNANDRILFSRNTIIKDLMFLNVVEMEGKIILGYSEFRIIFKATVFDYSTFSYAVGSYVHWIIFKHRCFDICLRNSLYVCFSQGSTIQGMTLFRELGQDCIGCVKMWRVIVQFLNAYEKEPRFADKAERSLFKLFNGQVTIWVDNMNTVEKVIDALKKEDVEGELADRVKHDVAIDQMKLQRGEVNQRCAISRVTNKINTCKTCCCVSQSQIGEQEYKAIPVVVKHDSYGKDNLFDNMLDRSRLRLDEFEDQMCIPVNKDNTIMFLICSVTLDLVDEYEEMCSLASKDNTLLSLMFSVTLDLTDLVEDL